jgi:hypothetical protein
MMPYIFTVHPDKEFVLNKTAITIASILGVGVIGYFAWKKFGHARISDEYMLRF